MLMPLFEKKYSDYLSVYKVPIGPNQLDPCVFYISETGDEPKLLPGIQAQIANDLEKFVSGQPQRIKNYYLVGPATIPGNKTRTGELKVIIELNKELMDVDVDGVLAEEILKLANSLSGRLAVGTNRKIVYMPTVRGLDPKEHEGVYNVLKHCWAKLPSGVTK